MVEYLVEGIDYKNANVPWSNANNVETGVASATAVTGDYKNTAGYKSFENLDDQQRQAVLNYTGYMPLYRFKWSNAVLNRTFNGVASSTTPYSPGTAFSASTQWRPSWHSAAEKVYYVEVAGWRDKYILMPEGSQNDVYSAVTQGSPRYLVNDSAQDGANPQDAANWVASTSTFTYKGELVGRYKDLAGLTYTQTKSDYYFPNNGYPGGYNEPHAPNEDGEALWDVAYDRDGQRQFDITSRASAMGTIMSRDPNWFFTAGPNFNKSYFQLGGYQKGRYTDDFWGLSTWYDTLNQNTASLNQSWMTTIPNQLAFSFKYWAPWETVVGWWVDNDDGSSWGQYDDEDEVPSFGWTDFYKSEWGAVDSQNQPYKGWAAGRWNIMKMVGDGDDRYDNFGWGWGINDYTIPVLQSWGYGHIAGANEYTSGKKGKGDDLKITLSARKEPTANVYQNYRNYGYDWTSNWHNIYDQRVQLSYQVKTQSTDLFAFRPIYGEVSKVRAVPIMESQTVWETRELTQPQLQQVSDVSYIPLTVRSADASAKSIEGVNISITAGGSVSLRGLIDARGDLTVNAGGNITVAARSS
jgi:hypothetical protein